MTRDEDFLSRWSRRKHQANRGEAPAPAPAPAPEKAPTLPAAHAATPQDAKPEHPLPAVESLTPESDFSAFMRQDVDPALRRQALKTLFRDPRFNVMDGLDVYIDDYSRPDPIPADWLGKLNQMARLGDYRPAEAETAEATGPADPVRLAADPPQNQVVEEDSPPREEGFTGSGSPEPESKQS